MKLAWNEIKFYKLRYILIMLIIILLSTMVLFISGLAQGLGRENVSLFDQLKSEHYIIQDMKAPQIEKSYLTQKQQNKIEDIINTKSLKMKQQSLNIKGENNEDVLATNSSLQHKFNLIRGHYPKHNNQIVVNEKLIGKGVNIGDKVQFKNQGKTYKVTGILKDAMYSHSSIVMMSQQGFSDIKGQYATFYPVSTLSQHEQQQLKEMTGVQVTDENKLKDNIASYQAEQAPLTMMIISLFVISAIVLSAFFYVMTIQKVSEIGILKAIGIKTIHLLKSLTSQILIITLLSVLISVIIIISISFIIPVTMPFYLANTNYILVIAIFIIVSFIGSLLSFIKVVKIDPLDAIGGGE